MGIRLLMPTVDFKEDVLCFKKELYGESPLLRGICNLNKFSEYNDWLYSLSNKYNSLYTPSVTYLVVTEDMRVIGLVELRLSLNDYSESNVGNILFVLSKSERGKGYGEKIFVDVLCICEEYGLKEVTVLVEEGASERIALNSGGIFLNKVYMYDNIYKRYSIDLE